MAQKKKKIVGYTIFIDRMLGEGAFGKVYIGQQDNTKLKVAIKALSKVTINRDPYIRNALFSQIDILKSLKSPNIVGFLDVLESDNYYYIVQEFCNGGDLKGVMNKKGPMSENEAIGYLTQICNGFVELIKQGVIHRDLKPENILVNQGVLKLADFGFSKRQSSARMKNQTMVGTPLYMSLQILKGQPYTSKCDIWALGLIFYELMTGRTPWDGNSQYELIMNIQRRPLNFPPNISQISKDFITRCCKVNQKDRFSWDQLLRHQIFNGYFSKKGNQNTYQNKYKQFMRQLRLKIKTDNIDLERLFRRLNFTRQSQLKLNEFKKFMQSISLNFPQEEVKYVFDRLDADKSNTVSFKELEDQLKRYNIPMQSAIAQIPGYVRKDSNSNEDEATLKKVQKKLTDGFKALAARLQKQNVALHSFFAQFDRFGDNDLKKDDFVILMKGMEFPFAQNQMSYVFKVIDTDQSGTISYYEFYKFFCKVVGQPHQPFRQQKREVGMTPPPKTPQRDITPPRQRMPQSPPMPQMPFQQVQPMGYGQPGMNFGQIDPMMNYPVQAMMNGMPIGGMGMPQMLGYPQNRPANNPKFNVPGFTGNGWDY